MSERESIIHGAGAKLTDIKIGDSIIDPKKQFIGWVFVCEIPLVAVFNWIENNFVNAKFTARGRTPSQGPFKEWEEGMGIIVASSITAFDEEELIALVKKDKDIFHLMRSNNSRKIEDPKYDWTNYDKYYAKQRRGFFR